MEPKIIKGGVAVDDRGVVTFNNSFNMWKVKRFYMLQNHQQGFVRAWHGHLRESKWVCVLSGVAVVAAAKARRKNPGDERMHPGDCITNAKGSEELFFVSRPTRFTLHPNGDILHIPPGYANGHMNLVDGTRVLHFSDMSMEDTQNVKDDYRFDAGIHRWVWEVEER